MLNFLLRHAVLVSLQSAVLATYYLFISVRERSASVANIKISLLKLRAVKPYTGWTLSPDAFIREVDQASLEEKLQSLPNEITFKIIPLLKRDVPTVRMIHYLTDSPTSQYRNRTIFAIVARHEQLFQLKATWSYFEAGHGKGPCDGIGGASKRMADNALKHGIVVQNAADYAAWGNTSGSAIEYIYVPVQDIGAAAEELQNLRTVKVTGTMTLHAVVCTEPGIVAIRETSCFAKCCFDDGQFHLQCEGWRKQNIVYSDHYEEPVPLPVQDQQHIVELNEYVAAVYDDKWFLGQVIRH